MLGGRDDSAAEEQCLCSASRDAIEHVGDESMGNGLVAVKKAIKVGGTPAGGSKRGGFASMSALIICWESPWERDSWYQRADQTRRDRLECDCRWVGAPTYVPTYFFSTHICKCFCNSKDLVHRTQYCV
jgi:hypothetical protein